jgi:hypothetical protein
VESAPRAYKLKASNAAPPISTITGTCPPGARRADVSDFGVPEHPDNGSALQMLVQSGNLSFEIAYREDFS